MSDTLADLASCLPSHFSYHQHMDHNTLFHFPYDIASSSSTESESDDDDFSVLTRRFTRSVSLQDPLKTPYPLQKRVFSGSPESTLGWTLSGPAHVRSSPSFQAEEDAWDLIYAAAGQVARMKMRANNVNDDVFTNRGIFGAPRPLPLHHQHHPNCTIWRNESEEFIKQHLFRWRVAGAVNYGGGGPCGVGQPVGFRKPAWPPQPVENQRRPQPSNGLFVKPVLPGSGGVGTAGLKRECAGTGVFLPRRYLNDPPEPKKKPVCWPVNVPARAGQPLKKNMDPITAEAQPNIHGGFGPQYEITRGGRKTVVVGRSSGPEEVVLPQEWTY